MQLHHLQPPPPLLLHAYIYAATAATAAATACMYIWCMLGGAPREVDMADEELVGELLLLTMVASLIKTRVSDSR